MATTDPKAPGVALRARIEERFFAQFKRNSFATRTWFIVTVTLVLAFHGAVLGWFLYRDAKDPQQVAQQTETPVEIVVEKPPAPPALPQPPAPKPQQQEIEKPATSAPRAESDSKIDTEKLDAKTEAPKAEAPPKDGQPAPAEDSAETNKATTEADAKEKAAAKPDVLKKDAEALDKAAPDPKKDAAAKAEKAKVAARRKRAKATQQQLAGLSDTPDYHFAKRTKKSPVSGGSEDSRYLAIVYGIITQNTRAVGEGSVTVNFELDDDGGVVGIELAKSSGDPLADAEVINAVRRSSPFPPPPPNRPHGLTATIGFSRHPVSIGEQ